MQEENLDLKSELENAQRESEALKTLLEQKNRELFQERDYFEKTNEFLTQVMETMSMSVVVINEDLSIRSANSATREIFGFDLKTLVGRSLTEVFPKDWIQCSSCVGLNGIEQEFLFERVKDHKKIPIVMLASGMFDEFANCIGAVCTFTDVTSRKALEQELLHTKKMESIGRLAAGVAHEINTPIQYIRDNVQFIEEELGTALPQLKILTNQDCAPANLDCIVTEFPAALKDVIKGVETVARIVQSLKEFSHPGSSEKVLIDIHQALESTSIISKSEWKYAAELVLNFDATVPQVPGFPGELNQVFLNLIVNATHAILDREPKQIGLITISTKCHAESVEISISDNGAGIPLEIQSKIFDPFFTTKPMGKGTGQGLSFAYNTVVERHQGTLKFVSEVGVGTTFIITLPLSPV